MKSLEQLSFAGWGRFLPETAAYRVERYHLPREWDHILGDERLFWRLHHNGRSYVQEQPPGGTYWLRATGAHDVPPWQVFGLPDGNAADAFTNFRGPRPEDVVGDETPGEFACEWHPACARWVVTRAGLRVTSELAVLDSMPAVAMRVTVTNLSPGARSVVVMPRVIPWLTATQAASWDMPWLFQRCVYDADSRSVRLSMGNPAGVPERRRALRLVLDRDFDRLTFDEAGFHGRGSRDFPEGLHTWQRWARPNGAESYGYPLFTALASELKLAGDGSCTFSMLLADDAQHSVSAMQQALARFDAEVAAMAARKQDLLSRAEIQTPDPAFSRYVNEYLALQQQLVLRRGWPSNMRGVRDTAQDYTGPVAWYPAEVRATLLEILETERSDGWFLRQYSTDGRKGVHDARPYVDSGLWVWELAYEYVCQTRDFAVLDEKLPFLDSDACTTVSDHLARLLRYYSMPENLGEHGLCKIREGDWNDSANRAGLEGRGESVMVTCHLVLCLEQAARLRRSLGARGEELPEAESAQTLAASLRQRVRKHALNPLGFLNGVFSDRGCWFFSDRDPDGCARFNVPVNAFGLIAGIFTPVETQALCARLKAMRTPHGYPLYAPPLGTPPVDGLGRIGSGDLPAGLGENGACYNHGCHGFLARALALVGEGDLWLDAMQFLFPYDEQRHPVEAARSAPYAIVNVYKLAPGREGEGGDTFFSGTIAVAVRNVYQSMLGAYAEPEGIRFRPCLPTAWSEVSARIPYAGRGLKVRVSRTATGYSVEVDGRTLTEWWYPAPV